MDFNNLVRMRRSCRHFTAEEIKPEDLQTVLRAALMSPTSKGQQAWRFIVVDDKGLIEKIADAKDRGAQFMKEALLAIVVLGDVQMNDCWIEDGAIAAISMQYQAADLGLGSCWVQMRGRGLSDGHAADEVLHGILDIPENLQVLCVIAIGYPAEKSKPKAEERLKWENISIK
ncbi:MULTISPECIES: nitroreductase family protein [Prevotellaceae]|uniref:nitroreductase family protein n=1 Tax=Prevotellaceae TaxID=171552 RepID=UPI0003D349A9|nr:nitroreductase family protein [Prevotella phocaeensis]ETD21732.1 hypothetical protein HMPREF1199_00062 [Hoylesella oralis CC98A]